MNEQDMLKFIQWLPDNVEEFKGKTPEQCFEVLSKLVNEDGGEKIVEEWVSAFKKSNTNMFRKGGKLDYLVNKLQKGGRATRLRERADRIEARQDSENDDIYNRQEARTRKINVGGVDEYGDMNIRGNQNVLAKKAKAASVTGFNESLYNYDPNQEFDRDRYRDRKRDAKQFAPDWTRRQRKAWALMDAPGVDVNIPTEPISIIPEIGRRRPGKAVVSVGEITAEMPTPTPNTTTYSLVRSKNTRTLKPKTIAWDQFAGAAYDKMAQQHAFRGDQDTRAAQAYVASQYAKYANDPMSYVWTNPEEGYAGSAQMLADEAAMRRNGFTGYRRSYGYYDPNDATSQLVFSSEGYGQALRNAGIKDNESVEREYWVDANGNEVTNTDTIDMLNSRYGRQVTTPEQRSYSTSVEDATFNPLERSQLSTGLSRGMTAALAVPAIGIMGSAAGTGSVRTLGTYTQNLARQGFNNFRNNFNNYRQGMGEMFEDMARESLKDPRMRSLYQPRYLRAELVRGGAGGGSRYQIIGNTGKFAPSPMRLFGPEKSLYLFRKGGKNDKDFK